MSCCKGPGYSSPLEAFTKGAREQLLYAVCVQPDRTKQDYLATVDVDPKSQTYCKVIHRTYTGNVGDELHHSGWNVCSSCHDNPELKRDLLILPALGSCNVYAVDVGTDPRKPEIHKVIDGREMRSFNCSYPHTAHCLATGEIMISTMGDKDENGKGDFVLIDSKTLRMTGTWTKGKTAKFGYDFWYQPYHDVMIASEWGTPKYFKTGFHADDVNNKDRYGSSLNVYKWSTRELQQVIDLGKEGIAPLEIRFLHDPKAAEGFVGCALEANVYRFYKTANGTWKADKVIDVPAKKVSRDGVESQLNGLMSDVLISLDDKYLYFSCWLHGDVRQYDISDTKNPKLTGIVRFGGLVQHDKLKVLEDKEFKEPSPQLAVKGKQLQGAPQMLQLSLDGKRLYVSSSLFSPWDKQTYPKMTQEGGWIVKLDVDIENGGMKLDPEFLVHFGDEPNGPALPHEMRYPGGDCTSDIWLAQDA
ncbi:methanethiol oxidase isoform X2 [Plodia interpunctella]|uniref:methanethiol oxidase isoform X2 n=1 Tax=Plodia interpunctella TaxID=58824 RepID=UPI002368BB42|nr:methanethiol oxidase isoform X2 [Plodia interpunctella]